jgi:hypothetical protein
MRTLIRTAVWLSLIIWLGGMFFFVVTAWASFSTVPDAHVAGTIVAKCLHVLHHEGLVAGCIILAFLAIGRARGVYTRGVKMAIAVVVIMMGLNAFSEYWVMRHMDADRVAVGGAIDNVPSTDPHHADFDRLHRVSEHMETAAMIGGLVLVVLLSLEHYRD